MPVTRRGACERHKDGSFASLPAASPATGVSNEFRRERFGFLPPSATIYEIFRGGRTATVSLAED